VRLSRDTTREQAPGEPERRYEMIRLEVRPREQLSMERELKRVELKLGMAPGQLELGDVEIRADRSKHKVWFVERETGRIIATLDVVNGATTGPDDTPPAWATPTGGVPLATHR
jgi:hypothetical protein